MATAEPGQAARWAAVVCRERALAWRRYAVAHAIALREGHRPYTIARMCGGLDYADADMAQQLVAALREHGVTHLHLEVHGPTCVGTTYELDELRRMLETAAANVIEAARAAGQTLEIEAHLLDTTQSSDSDRIGTYTTASPVEPAEEPAGQQASQWE